MVNRRSVAACAAPGCLPALRTAILRCAGMALVVASLTSGSLGNDRGCAGRGPGPGCVDFWVVSSRDAPCSGDFLKNLGRIAFWHAEAGGWAKYTLEQFLAATESTLPICFYVHGVFSGEPAALTQARDLFEQVGAGMPPFRGVLWSWPSDFECGTSVRDQVRRGIATSQAQAYYLATIIDMLGPRVAVSLVGHSLGCRTVSATLHGLAAREIAGQPLSEPRSPAPRPIQAALIAPAIDPMSLWPKGRYGLA